MVRLIRLEGGRNFRDLGGYPTLDGRRVKWGRVFRSGVLAHLTAADCASLDGLGIRVLCDFRHARERRLEAVRWTRTDLEQLSWDYDPAPVSLRGILGTEAVTPEAARSGMIRLYRSLPFHLHEPYAALFSRLAAGSLPLVFGCAAGKDRTGLAAALVLTALGVDRERVFEDFQLTNQAVDLEKVLLRTPESGLGLDADLLSLRALQAETRAPMLHADPDYLDAALDAIESEHGSIDDYLHTRLGISDSQVGQIREHLLET